jgi:high-affinity Fe2+/Pb2+ permease
MQERLNQYRPILAVLIAAGALLAAVTSRYDLTAFYICIGAWALLAIASVIWMSIITRQNRRRFGNY